MQNCQSSCSYVFVQGSQSGPVKSPQFTHEKMATAKLKKISYPNCRPPASLSASRIIQNSLTFPLNLMLGFHSPSHHTFLVIHIPNSEVEHLHKFEQALPYHAYAPRTSR